MTRPRFIEKGEVVMGTRRCSERRFFLRPSSATDHLFLYCLARAARISGVLLHEFQVLPNHYHIVFSDPDGNRSDFFRELNQFVARAVNASLGRWENLFAPGSFNAVVLLDGEAIEDKLLYTLCNVVAAGLVKLPEYWDGICSWSMEYGVPKPISRPEGFFRPNMRNEEILVLFRPEALYPGLDDRAARAELRARARHRSHAIIEALGKRGGAVVGMERVRKLSPFSAPSSFARRRGMRPTVASRNASARVEALQRRATFLREYRESRLQFEAGNRAVVFPHGTYLMARRYGVAVEN